MIMLSKFDYLIQHHFASVIDLFTVRAYAVQSTVILSDEGLY